MRVLLLICMFLFTSIEKLGINPQSGYNTPLGIYAYPAEYVWGSVEDEDMADLPFAGNRSFANIFNGSGNIVDLNNMTNQEVLKYFELMKKFYLKNTDEDWKVSVDRIEDIINQSSTMSYHSDMPGGRFWHVTMRVSQLLGWKKAVVTWNKMMREMGIEGCVDNGSGIIHSSEQNQAVFFLRQL